MPHPPPPPGRRYTPKRPWSPMTDAEWAEVLPHLRTVVMGEGRPLRDARQRIDGMFQVAVSGLPWHSLPEDYGKPDTVSRHFRRLAHAGLWLRLVGACANPAAPPALRRIEYFICRAARRAMRILGMDGARAVQRVGLLTALPVWPIYLPHAAALALVRGAVGAWLAGFRGRLLPEGPTRELRRSLRLIRFLEGKPWHRRWAPP
ncbi:transposase [Dankookia rubra]|uniref:Transposase n=1 Tax=Dankookia rubra TaxID=1442381 RepID=A0A4V3AA11_9PROT|nr:transposase [Dankookia rubra]TDH61345.1 transposase [Dankookia rubra]